MKEINIISRTNLFETFNYEIYFDDKFYNGICSPTSFISNLLIEKKPSPLKIIVSNNNKEIFNIYKVYKTPLNNSIYTISFFNKEYAVLEANNFKIPDFLIETDFGNLEISGTVSSGQYTITLLNNIVANISSKKTKDSKEYTIYHNLDFNNSSELLISATLIIDSLYHYY